MEVSTRWALGLGFGGIAYVKSLKSLYMINSQHEWGPHMRTPNFGKPHISLNSHPSLKF